MRYIPCILSLTLLVSTSFGATPEKPPVPFNPDKDLISLHYDHAPDKDDGHSAAADRTLLESLYGAEWLKEHVVPVSGAYGTNKDTFNAKSDAVMDAAWNERGGWLSAHRDWTGTVDKLVERWVAILEQGGDVWVKEGGQSDITADVLKKVQVTHPDLDTKKRIHVVQHGGWNERNTTEEDLAYTRENTDYLRIRDCNHYLKVEGGDPAFQKAAVENPLFGKAWKAAFEYYDPNKRLDYSDTGELFYLLDMGELSVKEFRERYLEPRSGNEHGG